MSLVARRIMPASTHESWQQHQLPGYPSWFLCFQLALESCLGRCLGSTFWLCTKWNALVALPTSVVKAKFYHAIQVADLVADRLRTANRSATRFELSRHGRRSASSC